MGKVLTAVFELEWSAIHGLGRRATIFKFNESLSFSN
jgi:hypothetical protein